MEVDHVKAIFGSFSRRRQSSAYRSPKERPTSPSRASVSAEDDIAPVDGEMLVAPSKEWATSVTRPATSCSVCCRVLCDPRLLPCLHSFCASCIEQLASVDWGSHSEGGGDSRSSLSSGRESSVARSSGGQPAAPASVASSSSPSSSLLQCPTCGHVARLPPGGVAALPVDYVAQHRILLQVLNSEPLQLLCDICPGDQRASWRCSECLVNLCDSCQAQHAQSERGRAHAVSALSVACEGSSGIARLSRHLTCAQHPRAEVRAFCKVCARLTCCECSASTHRGHALQPLAGAAAAHANALRDALQKARPAASQGATALVALKQLAERLQARCCQVQAEVERFSEAYAAALEHHRRALRRQTKEAADAKLGAVRAHVRRLERTAADAAVAVSFADDLLKEGSDAEVLSLSDPVLKRLQSVSERAPNVPLQQLLEASRAEADALAFLPTESAGFVMGFPMVGVVTAQAAAPAKCSLSAQGLLDCRVRRRAEAVLQTRDADGEPLNHGGEKIAAELRHRDASSRKLPVQVTDRRDGTYILTFVPEVPGRLALSVTVHDTPIQGSPFPVHVRIQKAHQGQYHCCSFCSTGGSKEAACGCGAVMPGGYRGCGHGHPGHPGRRHWSCCGNILENSECMSHNHNVAMYQFTL